MITLSGFYCTSNKKLYVSTCILLSASSSHRFCGGLWIFEARCKERMVLHLFLPVVFGPSTLKFTKIFRWWIIWLETYWFGSFLYDEWKIGPRITYLEFVVKSKCRNKGRHKQHYEKCRCDKHALNVSLSWIAMKRGWPWMGRRR